ncbi:hypothetical protein V6N13_011333 [Hibiscus sabdariffa]|uniref:Protein EXORDIUM-like 7 n=1 Tax=Hibiscus sabdariffa TaxID=183260 RepID=A0ABR2SCJ3_9ROSI
MDKFSCHVFLLLPFFCFHLGLSWSCLNTLSNQAVNCGGSPDPGKLEYHMGPVLASPLKLYIIWYGNWNQIHQHTIRDFLNSLSSPAPRPSVAEWWSTVMLYADQTGSNVTVTSHQKPLPLDPRNGLYLVLTSADVLVDEFCRAVCAFHYFTFPATVGVIVPYAWIGYSGTQCPGMCAYPFAMPAGMPPPPSADGGNTIMRPPNGDVGVDGMISVIAHELAETASNPLVNAWYAGNDPTAPGEIADLCQGVYGSGAGGTYVGQVSTDASGNGYNVNGVKGRRFMVQWVWNPVKKRCFGPNAMD